MIEIFCFWEIFISHSLVDKVVKYLIDNSIQALIVEDETVTLGINHLTLDVHTFCEFKRLTTWSTTRTFTGFLGFLNQFTVLTTGQFLRLNVVTNGIFFVSTVNPWWTVFLNYIVFKWDEEFRHTRVPLTSRTATNLQVNTLTFHTFGTDNYQTSEFSYTFTKLDVRSTSSHWGRNRHGTHLSWFGNHFRFTWCIVGIQEIMSNSFTQKQGRIKLWHFHRPNENQDGVAFFMVVLDIL